jgi:two-component system cell cycle response regulator
MRILIADDDLSSLKVLEHILVSCGHQVAAASDGLEAWEALSGDDPPRLAIIDWVMPHMDGLELCRKVRSEITGDRRYIYVILLTANDAKEDIIAGMVAGADDYIVKPFHRQELEVRVRAGQRILDLEAKLLRAQDDLEYLALHDPLTGILNRRALFTALDAELARAVRNPDLYLSIAMLDIDHFKKVNDTHGHETGDEVLCELVRRVRSALRGYDVLGRYGGEEFVVLVSGEGTPPDRSVFERMREAVSSTPMSTTSGRIRITASFGVVTSDGRDNRDLLLAAADSALYEAKNAGRNRVVITTPVDGGTR